MGDMLLGPYAYRGNYRTPPRWDPALEHQYPFREFVLDTVIWARATDVDVERQGPLLVMGLGGMAARMAREVPPDLQAHGGMMDLGDRGRSTTTQWYRIYPVWTIATLRTIA